MPFPANIEPQAFVRQRIEALQPGQKGVYGMYRGDTWVYIGSGDIRDRLLSHLNGDNPCINRWSPTHWMAYVTSNYIAEEKRLIVDYDPACNEQVG